MKLLLSALILVSLSLVQCGLFKRKKAAPPEPPPAPVADEKVEPVTPAPPPVKKTEWSYNGATGPEFWGDLDEKFKVCRTGRSQSPVDLVWSRPTQPAGIVASYESSLLRVIDNGHSITLVVDPGSQISIRGEVYRLLQVHIHSPSEHRFSGKSYPIEIHFVHENAKGQLAVVGVMGTIGKANPAIAKLLAKLPVDKNKEFRFLGEKWNPKDLLPSKWHYYQYTGSLTTPPCSENVNWNVVNTPIELSLEQINMLQQIYVNNNRPTQPLNGRKVTNF